MMNSVTNKTLDHFLQSSLEVDTWPLMGSLWPLLLIISGYLLFVYRVGPHIMKDRKPFNIKPFMLIYNLYQVLSNLHMLSLLFVYDGVFSYLWNYSCVPMDSRVNTLWYAMNHSTWMYLVSKIVDLTDTIIFILRKKQSHVTFLHVYHHTSMLLSTWFFLKYFKHEQAVIIGIINTFVHVIMYSYYFLAALGPSVQKYLWWKKYITRLQMGQFILFFLHMVTLGILKCPISSMYGLVVLVQAAIFFALFLNFYIKTYSRRAAKTPNVTRNDAEEKTKIC